MTLHPFETRLAEVWPPADWQPVGVLIGVSGGADSVALLRAMAALCPADGQVVQVAHLNHSLRGAEADADEQFVVELCRGLSVPCHVGRADVAAEAARSGQSLETTGREARYAFLKRTAEGQGLRYVAVAHTADDQVETVLWRLLRGTGVAGLAGIPRTRSLGDAVTLLRPLLTCRRTDVIDYLTAIGQTYREDASNADVRFTRNRVRRELLPLLRTQYNAHVDDAVLRLATLASEERQIITELVDRLRDLAVMHSVGASTQATATTTATNLAIDCRQLADVHPYLVRELFVSLWTQQQWPQQAMGFEQWEQLRVLAQSNAAEGERAAMFPGTIRAERRDSTLMLSAQP
ncbi:MAG: tRNA lysidine(34) synthetase TilS [Planctomycetia bacterium]|nr:tRNA lysidine(34) synthetase TilS [Planctomycetia bacterium]